MKIQTAVEWPTVRPLQAKTIVHLGTGGPGPRWRLAVGSPRGRTDLRVPVKGLWPFPDPVEVTGSEHLARGRRLEGRPGAAGEAAGGGAGLRPHP